MEKQKKNILFIVTDQYRADCMSCAGHPILKTPNIDRLAQNGTRFVRCYSTSAVCVPARASISTGRYVQSHRVWWNETPWPDDEKLMGHYLKDIGVRSFQCGKSHYSADYNTDVEKRKDFHYFDDRLAIGPFPDMETIEYNDGWMYNKDYRQYLLDRGYPKEFSEWPHQLLRPDGTFERWAYDGHNSNLPCALKTEDTDTAFTSGRALEFLDKQENRQPWMLFLSYYRPHQPYCPSGQYYRMYDPGDVPAPLRDPGELENSHVTAACQRSPFLKFLQDDSYVRWMRSAYYGLISELDDWMGRIMDKLKEKNLLDKTLVIFTSDHGDYLGDHYMWGKESFYDQAYMVPLIIADPSPEADLTRGKTCDEWVQLVDILPTMLDWYDSSICRDIEGHSLLPFIRGKTPQTRRTEVYAGWEYRNYCNPVYSTDRICPRGINVRDNEFNYWYFPELSDVLFDLEKDANQFLNVACEPKYGDIICRYRTKALGHLLKCTDARRVDWRFSGNT